MKGLETILARIESDAQAKIDALKRDNEAEVNAIREKYSAERSQLHTQLHTLGQQTAKERYERLCSAAEMESKKLTLAARQEVLSEAYELALEKLCAISGEEYVAMLTDLAMKASRDGGALLFSDKDRAAVGEEVVSRCNAAGRHLVLSADTAPIRAGFILDEGETEVNCSFEALVHAVRQRTEREVAALLFP